MRKVSCLNLSNFVPYSPTEASPNSNLLLLRSAQIGSHYVPADPHTALVRKRYLSQHVDYGKRTLLLRLSDVELEDFYEGVGGHCEKVV